MRIKRINAVLFASKRINIRFIFAYIRIEPNNPAHPTANMKGLKPVLWIQIRSDLEFLVGSGSVKNHYGSGSRHSGLEQRIWKKTTLTSWWNSQFLYKMDMKKSKRAEICNLTRIQDGYTKGLFMFKLVFWKSCRIRNRILIRNRIRIQIRIQNDLKSRIRIRKKIIPDPQHWLKLNAHQSAQPKKNVLNCTLMGTHPLQTVCWNNFKMLCLML